MRHQIGYPCPTKLAFSLVELSVVLVILGLLVGGVLSGKSLIRAAELRSVTTDYNRYQTAVHAFKDKYFALPGDMPNAVRFWGARAGGTSDGIDPACLVNTTPSSGTATCNGNGNGPIHLDTDYMASPDHNPYESTLAWQHLTNAGLIEGKYTGIGVDIWGQTIYVPGVNAPKSKLAGGFWAVFNFPSGGSQMVTTLDVHYFALSAVSGAVPAFAGRWYNELLNPTEQWSIDAKIDDGKPYTGRMMAIYTHGAGAFGANCVGLGSAADYRLTYTDKACVAMFRTSF